MKKAKKTRKDNLDKLIDDLTSDFMKEKKGITKTTIKNAIAKGLKDSDDAMDLICALIEEA